MLIIEMISINKNDPKLLCLAMILLFQSITDYINNDVYLFFNLLLLLININNINSMNYSSFLVPIILLIINKAINGIGFGDIEIIFVLSFIFNIYELFLILFFASSLNLIYAFFYKKDKYPFIPFLSIAILIIYFVSNANIK